MTVKDLKVGRRYWCWWMSRYIWYRGRISTGYQFSDIADCEIVLDAKKVGMLEQ